MPAIAPIVLANFTADELSFEPLRQDSGNGVITYVGPGASYDARPVLTLLTTYPKTGSTRLRQRWKISIPVMDTIDTTKKVDELIFTCEVSLPKNSVLATRNDLFALGKGITDLNAFREFIQDFTSPI